MNYKVFKTVFLMLLFFSKGYSQKQNLVINVDKKGAEISKSMYGVFFEEISHAGDGGLYAEMVKNRSFEELEMPAGYKSAAGKLIPKQVANHISGKVDENASFEWPTQPVLGWNLQITDPSIASMELTKENPKFKTAPTNLKITIKNIAKPIWLINEGYWGMGVKKGEKYHLRTIFRTDNYSGKIIVKLTANNGDVIASTILNNSKSNNWNDVETTLVSSITDAKAKLVIEMDAKGIVCFDYVSLFPENTFKLRKNGLRNDVANMLSDLKPAFMRWPGGCVVEGITTGNRFEWKKSLGDPAGRSGEYSTWGYRCSYGFGYYEYLQFCEDIGADAMFVCSVGIGCQYRMGDACSKDSVSYYLNDCLDAIEYALGDKTTKWGAKRMSAGHAKPFPLKYVEIGNENWGVEYDNRFDLFYAAIKKKYPQLTLISNHNLGTTQNIAKTDMIDPHWYVSPDYFFGNTTLFDNQSRGKYSVYVGEYACNQGVGAGNMTAALSEAAFLSGMERNGDLVKMASYAPLFENSNKRNWSVNLIWLNSNQVMGRSSYYVQKMNAANRPSYNVKSNFTMSAAMPEDIKPGGFGLGSWETQVEFKDIKVTHNGNTTNLNSAELIPEKGAWNSTEGILSQTSLQPATKALLKGFKGDDYTLQLQVRKKEGKEGFVIFFGMSDDGKSGYAFNVAGWNNTTTAVERVVNGNTVGTIEKGVPQSLETSKWYDVKLVGTKASIELYVDGKLMLNFVNKTQPKQFFASGYDEVTGEMVLKVVNAANTNYEQAITIKGANSVAKTGKIISLSAHDGLAENSFENPQNIYPVESYFNQFGKEFSYLFPPFSYTILRVNVSK